MANKYMKRCSISLVIRESKPKMEITTHLLEWLLSKKQEKTSVGENVEKKGTLVDCWWECKLVQPLWKTLWRFLRKLKIELPYDPAVPLLGIYLDKTIIQKDTCTPIFIAARFTIAKTWKQPKCPLTDEQIQWNTIQP